MTSLADLAAAMKAREERNAENTAKQQQAETQILDFYLNDLGEIFRQVKAELSSYGHELEVVEDDSNLSVTAFFRVDGQPHLDMERPAPQINITGRSPSLDFLVTVANLDYEKDTSKGLYINLTTPLDGAKLVLQELIVSYAVKLMSQ